MRSSIWTIAALAVLVPLPALAASGLRVVDDEGMVPRGRGRGRRPCPPLRGARGRASPAGGLLAVDARPNGGIEVRGWDRQRRPPAGQGRGHRRRARPTARETWRARCSVETTGYGEGAVGPSPEPWIAAGGRASGSTSRGTHSVRLQADNGGLQPRGLAGRRRAAHGERRAPPRRRGVETFAARRSTAASTWSSPASEWRGRGRRISAPPTAGCTSMVPEGYDARLEAGTVNGGVHSDLPVTTRGRRTGGRIETDLGHGGRLIRVETTNGGLHLQRR